MSQQASLKEELEGSFSSVKRAQIAANASAWRLIAGLLKSECTRLILIQGHSFVLNESTPALAFALIGNFFDSLGQKCVFSIPKMPNITTDRGIFINLRMMFTSAR